MIPLFNYNNPNWNPKQLQNLIVRFISVYPYHVHKYFIPSRQHNFVAYIEIFLFSNFLIFLKQYNIKRYHHCLSNIKCIFAAKKQPTCGPNEVYDECDAPCPGRSCDVDPRLVRCKAPPKPGDEECIKGCRCKDGFARNKKGQCIPREKCRKLLNSEKANTLK